MAIGSALVRLVSVAAAAAGLSYVRWLLRGWLGTPEAVAMVAVICLGAGIAAGLALGPRRGIVTAVGGALVSDLVVIGPFGDPWRTHFSQTFQVWSYIVGLALVTGSFAAAGGLAGGSVTWVVTAYDPLEDVGPRVRVLLAWTALAWSIGWPIWLGLEDNAEYFRSYALGHLRQGQWSEERAAAFIAEAQGTLNTFLVYFAGTWGAGSALIVAMALLERQARRLMSVVSTALEAVVGPIVQRKR